MRTRFLAGGEGSHMYGEWKDLMSSALPGWNWEYQFIYTHNVSYIYTRTYLYIHVYLIERRLCIYILYTQIFLYVDIYIYIDITCINRDKYKCGYTHIYIRIR